MTRLVHRLLACGIAVAALACQRAPTAEPPPAWPAEFAAYPGARRLCWGRDPAGALRVRWTLYASADEPATVAAFYARAHRVDPGLQPFVVRGGGLTTLAVHPAAATGVPRCTPGLAPAERAVILVSTAASRLAPAQEAR